VRTEFLHEDLEDRDNLEDVGVVIRLDIWISGSRGGNWRAPLGSIKCWQFLV
jgi:hypothetical protein